MKGWSRNLFSRAQKDILVVMTPMQRWNCHCEGVVNVRVCKITPGRIKSDEVAANPTKNLIIPLMNSIRREAFQCSDSDVICNSSKLQFLKESLSTDFGSTVEISGAEKNIYMFLHH